MKNIILNLIIIAIATTGVGFGEEQTEKSLEKSIVGGVNMTQTGFDNWAAGGENAFAWQLNLNYKFVQDLEKTNWSTAGKFVYGAT